MFLTKLSKFSPNCCWHNARYICYTYCGAVHTVHIFAVECGVACCATNCPVIATLRLPHTTLIAHQLTQL